MAVWPTAGTECPWCTRTPCRTAHPDATSMVFFSQQQGFSEDWWKPAIHKSMRSFCHSIWRSLRIENVSLPELITANESAKNKATSWYPLFFWKWDLHGFQWIIPKNPMFSWPSLGKKHPPGLGSLASWPDASCHPQLTGEQGQHVDHPTQLASKLGKIRDTPISSHEIMI